MFQTLKSILFTSTEEDGKSNNCAVEIAGHEIVFDNSDATVEQIREFAPLSKWLQTLNTHILSSHCEPDISSIELRDFSFVDSRVRSVVLNSSVSILKGSQRIDLAGFTLVRGTSVSVLCWTYNQSGVASLVLFRHPRATAGKSVWECPSMQVDSSSLTHVEEVSRCLSEDIGMTVDSARLFPLSSETDKPVATFLHPEAMDETVIYYSLFLTEEEVNIVTMGASPPVDIEEADPNDIVCVPLSSPKVEEDNRTLAMIALASRKDVFSF